MITKKEKELLDAIKEFMKDKGFAPTNRELCKVVGNKSPATVNYKLKNLKEKGFIDYEEGHSRSIRVLNKSTVELPNENEEL